MPNPILIQGEYSPGGNGWVAPPISSVNAVARTRKRNLQYRSGRPARLPDTHRRRVSGYRLPLSKPAPSPVVNCEKLPCVPRRSGVRHGREQTSFELLRRECDGHPEDGAADRCRSPSIFQNGWLLRRISTTGHRERNRDRPSFQMRQRRSHLCRRQFRHIRFAGPIEKIEDVVPRQ